MAMQEPLGRLADAVVAARRRRFGTVEAAIRAANVSRATWLRVEDGQAVREDSLAKIETSLGWPSGQAWRILAGETTSQPSPGVRPTSVDEVRAAIEASSLSDEEKALLMAQLSVMEQRASMSAQSESSDRSERLA